MTATNHDDKLGEIYPTMLNELNCTFDVSISRFHCRGRHGIGPGVGQPQVEFSGCPAAQKGVKVWVLVIALLTRLEQQRFAISEVAADWHELMIPWRIMRSSIARDCEQLDPPCSAQTYHRPSQRTGPSPSPRSP